MTAPRHWLVRPGDGRVLGDVLARMAADPAAVADGRVFVGDRRARSPGEAVSPGDVVRAFPPERKREAAARIVLHAAAEGVVAADKPAGIPTIPDHAGAACSLLAQVARALDVPAERVHPTSRLDRDVSGVVVFTLTRAARDRLARARAEGRYSRRYLAIAARAPAATSGTWDAPVGAAPAKTHYAVVSTAAAGPALLAVSPVTGRTHQIRIHAAHREAGAPLLGDARYGGPARLTLPSGKVLEPGRIALHAARVVVPDSAGRPLVLASPVPEELRDLWRALGGDPAAWDAALACALP